MNKILLLLLGINLVFAPPKNKAQDKKNNANEGQLSQKEQEARMLASFFQEGEAKAAAKVEEEEKNKEKNRLRALQTKQDAKEKLIQDILHFVEYLAKIAPTEEDVILLKRFHKIPGNSHDFFQRFRDLVKRMELYEDMKKLYLEPDTRLRRYINIFQHEFNALLAYCNELNPTTNSIQRTALEINSLLITDYMCAITDLSLLNSDIMLKHIVYRITSTLKLLDFYFPYDKNFESVLSDVKTCIKVFIFVKSTNINMLDMSDDSIFKKFPALKREVLDMHTRTNTFSASLLFDKNTTAKSLIQIYPELELYDELHRFKELFSLVFFNILYDDRYKNDKEKSYDVIGRGLYNPLHSLPVCIESKKPQTYMEKALYAWSNNDIKAFHMHILNAIDLSERQDDRSSSLFIYFLYKQNMARDILYKIFKGHYVLYAFRYIFHNIMQPMPEFIADFFMIHPKSKIREAVPKELLEGEIISIEVTEEESEEVLVDDNSTTEANNASSVTVLDTIDDSAELDAANISTSLEDNTKQLEAAKSEVVSDSQYKPHEEKRDEIKRDEIKRDEIVQVNTAVKPSQNKTNSKNNKKSNKQINIVNDKESNKTNIDINQANNQERFSIREALRGQKKSNSHIKPEQTLKEIGKNAEVKRKNHVISIKWKDSAGNIHVYKMHAIHGNSEANTMCEMLRKIHAQTKNKKDNSGRDNGQQAKVVSMNDDD